jgi:transcriptional regulator GlxA family with amidase domain
MNRLGLLDLDLLEQMFDHLTSCPFFVKDAQLRYRAANRAMAKLVGVRHPQQMLGFRAAEFFGVERAGHYEDLDRQVLSTGRACTQQFELSHGLQPPVDSKGQWLFFSRFPVRNANSRVVGVVATAQWLQAQDPAGQRLHRVAQSLDRLRQAPEKALGLGLLAKTAGVSSSQLDRDFMQLLGRSPGEFQQRARMERARQLLQRQELSIATIAYECGFADHSAFSRRFKATEGISPRAYRARLRSN